MSLFVSHPHFFMNEFLILFISMVAKTFDMLMRKLSTLFFSFYLRKKCEGGWVVRIIVFSRAVFKHISLNVNILNQVV